MAVTLHLVIDQDSQSIANNTSTVTVKVNIKWTGGSWNHASPSGTVTINGTSYSFSKAFNLNNTSTGVQTLYSKQVTVAHNADGTKTLTCSASFVSGVSSGTIAASASKELTTIPRKSTATINGKALVSSGTLGSAQTIKITRASTSFTHSIKYTCGSVTKYIKADGTESSSEVKHNDCDISWTPPASLASQNVSANSVSLKFIVTTYNGTTKIGTDNLVLTCSFSYSPSCAVSIVESGTSYAATYGKPIKGLSTLQVTITPTLAYSSPIASYTATVDGKTYTAATNQTDVINSSGNVKVTAKVTDKRGKSGSKETTISFHDYSSPAINKLVVTRCNSDGSENPEGEYVKATFSYNVASLKNGTTEKNSASSVIKYKATSDTTWASKSTGYTALSVTDGTAVIPANSGSSYDILFTITDNLSESSRATSASTGFTLMHWKANGRGMAIGKVCEAAYDDLFDVGFMTRANGGFKHPVLKPETDLNDIRTPNIYIGANITYNSYTNCPSTGGTFTLRVEGAGESGQVNQIFTTCDKTEPVRYIRTYYQDAWGEWMPDETPVVYVKTTGTNLNDYMFTGTYYFNSNYTPANIPSGCTNGWLVVMRADSGAIKQLFYRYGVSGTNDFYTFVRTGNGSTWGAWKRYSIEPEVLFTGTASGNVTLSQSAANFEYLEIFYTDNNGESGGYTKVYSPNGKIVNLSVIEAGNYDSNNGLNTYFRRSSYSISGTSITYELGGYVRVVGSTVTSTNNATTNYIRIVKVLGHRA